jgi:2,3-dihydroxy-p-cumate/2,3-dihydroxybenzoate 3,4-dioxygenase
MTDIRFKCLSYVAINCSDIEKSATFHREIVGISEVDGSGGKGPRVFASEGNHCDLVLFEGPPGLRRVAFELERKADLNLACERIAALGIAIHPIPEEDRTLFAQAEGVRVTEPNSGLTVELFLRDGPRPVRTVDGKPVTDIMHIGHTLITVQDFDPVFAFFTETLNFRISDEIAGVSAFLRCFPNPYHHSFGVVRGTSNHLHHVNFMVAHLDDIGRAFHRLTRAGTPIVYGPGRHPPSGSVFLYFLDPDGMTFELSSGMEEFPEVDTREARALEPKPESIDYWGSVPTAEFGAAGDIIREPVDA